MIKKATGKASTSGSRRRSKSATSIMPRPPLTEPLPPIFVLVGFGNLTRKTFPYLYAFSKEGVIDLAVIDIKKRFDQMTAWKPRTFLEETGLNKLHEMTNSGSLVRRAEILKAHEDLRTRFWINDQPESRTLSPTLRQHLEKNLQSGRRPALFYIALHPDKYFAEIARYSKFATLIALEKPFSATGKDAGRLIKALKRFCRLKNVVAVDHYVFKPTIQLIDAFLRSPAIRHLIDYSDSIEFYFQEKRPAHGVAKRLGLIKDFGPHVMAVLDELTKSLNEIEFEQGAHTGTGHVVMEAYLELRLFRGTSREKLVHVHLGKSQSENKKSLIFHYHGDTLELDLLKQKVLVSYENERPPLELSAVPPHETEDPAYRSVFKSLKNGLSEGSLLSPLFLTPQKASTIIRLLDEMEPLCKLVEPGQVRPSKPLIKGLEPTVVFDLFGVILDVKRTLRAVLRDFDERLPRGRKSHKMKVTQDLLGLTGTELIKTILERSGRRADRSAIAEGLSLYTSLVCELEKSRLRRLLTEGAEGYLEFLRSKECTLVLLTGTPLRDLRIILSKLGLDRVFHSLVSLEDYPAEPKPWVIANTLRRIRRTREECILIDDSLSILQAASQSGQGPRTIPIGFGPTAWRQRAELWAKYRVRAVADVKALTKHLHSSDSSIQMLLGNN
jgi:beta-phosphoglucomutase-like phosphatase (HAD superfamily)